MKRLPAVAGQFYYGNPAQLREQVAEYIDAGAARQKTIAAISPHAGLMYSGHVAGAVYSSIAAPKTFLLIGPNHSGFGSDVSIMSSGEWDVPTATFAIDEELGALIKQKVPLVSEDSKAHRYEHSLEVQLPFIAYSSPESKILPITVKMASLQECAVIGKGIADAISGTQYDVVIIASSDMSHYEQDAHARKLDGMAIKEILALNPEGLYTTVMEERISMCGVIPSTIMLYAAISLGAKEANLVKYATSAEVSGDYDRVVGYAGIIIK